MDLSDMLRVGIVINTHGIRGEVKLWPTTDDVNRFHKGLVLYLDAKEGAKQVTVSSVKNFKNLVILKFEGIDSINDIERYKGCDLYVSREDAIPLAEGEYYVCDLVGCDVVEEDGTRVGTLTDVMTTGANDVYVVTTDAKKEVLLPVIPDCIKKVDIAAKTVTVYLMPGLM